MVKSINYSKKSDSTYWDEIAGGLYQMGLTNHRQHILDMIVENKIQSILDTGCGTGPIYELLIKEFLINGLVPPAYKGVDYSKKFIEIAQKEFAPHFFEVQDARHLKEKDNSFDLVLLMHLLDHVDDWRKVVSEAKRVSKKYIQIILWRSFTTEKDWVHQTVMNDTLYKDTYLQEYRKEDLEEEFKKQGLKILHQHEIINDNGKYNYCFFLEK